MSLEQNGSSAKQCSRCKIIKVISDFPKTKDKRYRLGIKSHCKDCQAFYSKQWHDQHPDETRNLRKNWRTKNRHLWWAISSTNNHKLRGMIIRYSLSDLAALAKQTKNCKICGVELLWQNTNRKAMWNSPTVDRINNQREISMSDIQIACKRCNSAKQEMLMPEFIAFCKSVIEYNKTMEKSAAL